MVSELTKIQVQFPWSTPKMIKNTHATYMQRRMCDGWKVLNMFRWTASYNQGRIQGGDRPDCPPKTTKVTLFTVILYKSENNIRDIRPFCSPLLCHSSVVKWGLRISRYSIPKILKSWTENFNFSDILLKWLFDTIYGTLHKPRFFAAFQSILTKRKAILI